VCISGATFDQVRKVLPMTFVDLGAQQVKNIQEPIRAYQGQAGCCPERCGSTKINITMAAAKDMDAVYRLSASPP
jgi:hypothetical protein